MEPVTIGHVARLAGVGVETVRFYERKGLLEKPARKHSGYRQYSEEAVVRLRFIKRAKELGFSLREIKDLLRLWHSPTATCEDVRAVAEAKLAQIGDRIKELRATERSLKKLVIACKGKRPLSECPILEALEAD